jgi:hypothetical protein
VEEVADEPGSARAVAAAVWRGEVTGEVRRAAGLHRPGRKRFRAATTIIRLRRRRSNPLSKQSPEDWGLIRVHDHRIADDRRLASALADRLLGADAAHARDAGVIGHVEHH